MIKGRRAVIISVAILVMLICIYIFLTDSQSNNDGSSKKGREIFTINKNDITSILCTPVDHEAFEIQYVDGEYLIKDYGPFKFDHQKFEALFDACATVTAERIIGAPEGNLNEYGLDTPEMKLEITDIDGTTRTLSIGIAGQLGNTRYVYYQDENLIFLMNYQQANQMLSLPEDYRIAEIFPETWSKEVEDISYLRFDYSDGRSALELYKREPSERLSDNYSEYYLTSPYLLDTLDEVVKSQLLVPLLRMDENVRVVEDYPSREMLKIYSLDEPSIIEVRNSNNDEIQILIGGKVGDFVFVKLSNSTPVMIIPSQQIEFFKQKKFDLINKTLINFYDDKMISAIEIATPGNSCLIKKQDQQEMSILVNNKLISKADAEKLMELLSMLKLSGEVTEAGQDGEILCRIKIFTEDKRNEYVITLSPIDSRRAAVYYNETATGFYIDMQSATELMEWLRDLI